MLPTKTKSIPRFTVKEIDWLKSDIKNNEDRIKLHEEKELQLQKAVEEKTTELRELKEKLQIDPGYHTLEFVEDKMVSKLENMKKIHSSINQGNNGAS